MRCRFPFLVLLCLTMVAIGLPAAAQETAREEAVRRARALATLPQDAAKRAFGQARAPADLSARAIGFYAKGCLAGGVAMPVDGEAWQVMRLSRNRNWGHPALISFLERFAKKAAAVTGWPGLLVGDLAQPKGGPMLTGHSSHQIGLDADVWLAPMPSRRLSAGERDEMSATDLVRPDRRDIDPGAYTPQHVALLRAAAREPEVERIFVNAAIKKALCRDAGRDRAWLAKVRPMYGHNYHFHIRLSCPRGEATCQGQRPPGGSEGCGAELDYWFSDKVLNPPPRRPRPVPPMTVAQLPAGCREVLVAK